MIDQLTEWSGRQYEGKPIQAAIGLVPTKKSGTVSLAKLCKHDFSAVLSNGLDTLLKCNLKGEVLGHDNLKRPRELPFFAPYRFSAIAWWARNGRIALALTRTGEILIFSNRELTFVRRAGRWHYLAHEAMVTRMRRPEDYFKRRPIYATCLDASFAHTGACIGIVLRKHLNKWKRLVTSRDDHLEPPISDKAKAISAMVAGETFQDLDRRLRQELLAIDGATLIDNSGKILAVGAILKLPGGSQGGARLAAAKALSRLGVGIKVSQDGGIETYDNGQLKFSLMKHEFVNPHH